MTRFALTFLVFAFVVASCASASQNEPIQAVTTSGIATADTADSARIFFATNYSGPDDGSGVCQTRGDRVLTPDTIANGVDLAGNRWGAVQIGDFVVVGTTEDSDDPENVQARCEFRFVLADFPGKTPPNGIDIGGYTYWQLSSSDSQIGPGSQYVADYAIIDFVKGN